MYTHMGPQFHVHESTQGYIHLQALLNRRYAGIAWTIWYAFTPCMVGSFGAKPGLTASMKVSLLMMILPQEHITGLCALDCYV